VAKDGSPPATTLLFGVAAGWQPRSSCRFLCSSEGLLGVLASWPKAGDGWGRNEEGEGGELGLVGGWVGTAASSYSYPLPLLVLVLGGSWDGRGRRTGNLREVCV
jgi:hypothetical protein